MTTELPVESSSKLYGFGGGAKPPAQAIDSHGQVHVDQRAILALSLPLMANSAIQVLFNLIDTWFIARISTDAMAAVGAIQWLLVAVLLVLGGGAMGVQAVVAHAIGTRRYAHAARVVWAALWITLGTAPLFVFVGISSRFILEPFGFSHTIQTLASEFWLPRVGGSCLGIAAWAILSFFYGIGASRAILLVTAIQVVVNTFLNQLFIFDLGWGVAGSGWATTVAQAVGLLTSMAAFLGTGCRRKYKSHLTWRPHLSLLWAQLRLGVPMGLLAASNLVGLSLFQMMQVRFGAVAGAATQLVSAIESLAYVPGVGIASASTTLVGQSIGAGDRDWAKRLGTRAIVLTALCTGTIGVALALLGPWLLPLFIGGRNPESAAVIELGIRLLWVAAAYEFFGGLQLGSSMCLFGAADTTAPALLSLPISWLIFVPLAHSLTFPPGGGWFDFLPQFGWGAIGGWIALVICVLLLGCTLFLRWQSEVWSKVHL